MWRDTAGFLHLGEKIASASGLNKYVVAVAPLHTRGHHEELPFFHTGRLVVGGAKPINLVRRSDWGNRLAFTARWVVDSSILPYFMSVS